MKMGMEEFRKRLGQPAEAGAIAIVEDGRVVAHYLPVAPDQSLETNLDSWAAARERFRQKWIARTPDWKERLSRYGLDADGEPFDVELPRFPA